MAGKIHSVKPVNYGVSDGLRSAQCAPGYPSSRGGIRSTDGRLWFPTGRGLAVLNPEEKPLKLAAPLVHLLEVQVDGLPSRLDGSHDLAPGDGRIQFRYTGIYLSAPEQVRYSYRLEGLDRDWTSGVARRVTNYNSLPHGRYRFVVRAGIPGGPPAKPRLPSSCCRTFMRPPVPLSVRCRGGGCNLGICKLRLRQIRQRFALVLDERARLAREIHDTLAQGFVGFSSQLDAVALTLKDHAKRPPSISNLARKMARHSLTEARRSVMDLRDSALEGSGASRRAFGSGARQWTAGSPVRVQVDVSGNGRKLPEEMEQNLLRIAQEAVTNTIKHAHAKEVRIRLDVSRAASA